MSLQNSHNCFWLADLFNGLSTLFHFYFLSIIIDKFKKKKKKFFFFFLKISLGIQNLVIATVSFLLMMELKRKKKSDKLVDQFHSRSTELNWGNIVYINEREIFMWARILENMPKSPCRHSFCFQRDGLPDKIWIVSNTFKWNKACDLLRTKKKFPLNFSA